MNKGLAVKFCPKTRGLELNQTCLEKVEDVTDKGRIAPRNWARTVCGKMATLVVAAVLGLHLVLEIIQTSV
jgi:hypothetical protein